MLTLLVLKSNTSTPTFYLKSPQKILLHVVTFQQLLRYFMYYLWDQTCTMWLEKNKKQFRSVVSVRYHICETLLQKLDSLKNWEDLKKSGKKAYLPLIRDGIWPVRICWLPVWWPSRCVLLYVDCTEYRRPDQTMIDHRYSTQQRKHRYRNSSGRTLVLPVKKKEIMKIKMFWHYYIILRPLY